MAIPRYMPYVMELGNLITSGYVWERKKIMRRCQNKSNISIIKDYINGISPCPTFGYNGDKNKYRRNGDRWKDKDGIEWERIDGKNIRLTKSQGDLIRELLNDKCKCGQIIRWGTKQDLYFYSRTGMCSDCLINYETKLRVLGVYPDYEQYKLLSYEEGTLKDALQQIDGAIKFFSETTGDVAMLCNSDGFTERWKNTNQEKILSDAKVEREAVEKRLIEVIKMKEEAKLRYKTGVEKYKLEFYV
jgi:hypothetical protein